MNLNKKDKIHKYIVTFPIKEGTYAETYRVKDESGKNRFLKLINSARLHRTQFDSDGNVLEIEITKQLNHPNIVKYIDSGNLIIKGRKFDFIIYDYISGETVAQFLSREGECSIYEAKNIILDVLEGLKYIHNLPKPVIHNEITPNNIMLDKTGGISKSKLIDFGYARYLSQGSNAFNKNGLSPFYLSPEAMNGVFSVKSDIFSVGALLYELIFGMPPYLVELSECKGNNNLQREKIDEKRDLPLFFPDIEKFELDEALRNVIRKALASDIDDRFETVEEFSKALKGEIKVNKIDNGKKTKKKISSESKGQDAKPKGEGFKAIAGMQELKDIVKKDIIDVINDRELYKKYGVTIPNGMLLYGPPGCGKTFFAKQLAAEIGFNFLEKKPSDLQSKWVNGTQENIAAMFKEAEENAPTIIFIDEMNQITPNRDSNIHEMSASSVNEMLAQMDRTGEKGIFIIGATNYPHLMDPAILRSGRLDKKLYVSPPDFEARKAMFELLLKKRPYDFGIDYDELSRLTENYVFSDLQMIIDEASRYSARNKCKISMEILKDQISKTKSSLSLKDIEKYKKIKAEMEGNEVPNVRPRVGFN